MSAGDTSDDDICFGSFGLDDNEGDKNSTTDIGVAGSNPASAKEDSSSSTTCANGADQAPPPPESASASNGPAPPPAAKKYSTWASLLSKPAPEQGGAAPSGSGTEAAGADTNGVNGHSAASGVGQGQKQMASAVDGKGKEAEASVRLDHLYKILSGLAEGTVTQALLERRARGLANTGNTCFRNVILQALLSCEPFYRVLWELKPALDDAALRPTCEAAVPTWMQLARLASSFEDPGLAKMVTYRKKEADDDDEVVVTGKKGKGRKTSSGSLSSSTSRPAREEWIGSVRPDDYLGEAFSEFRRCSPGQQEDAQEFLTFFLVKLHEEVLAVQKAGGFARKGAGGGGGAKEGAAANGSAADGHQDQNGHAESEGDGWQEIGKGGTKAVLNSTTTAEAEDRYDSSAITRVFHGRLRSDLRRAGSRTVSATFQRFECLQLDIKSREVGSVEDALNLYLSEETLTEGGFKGAKRMSLEVVPPVLILHLKRFTFDPARGPLKVVKPVDYAPSLTIPANLLSSSLKATLPKGARYNLYCVVLHFGRTVGGGHYTSYCRGHYPGEWYYFDDERVERVSEMQAISHKEQCYLCFYEREEA